MENDKEIKKIEDQFESKKYEMIEKYGFDIRENWDGRIKKLDKIGRIFKNILFIAIIIMLISSIYITHKNKVTRESIIMMRTYTNKETEIIKSDIGWSGDGFYVYRITENPDIEIHALREGNVLKSDVVSRVHKFFFEKWEDSEKNKFIVVENYEDCKYNLKNKENWLLKYQTYIEVNSYEQMIEATESIIRFEEYMKNPNLIVENYIKIGENLILPHNSYPQSDENIRENAKKLYFQTISEEK